LSTGAVDPQAVMTFAHKQKKLLRNTYDAAWQTGVSAYEPDEDPDTEPDTPRDVAEAGLTGTALLAVRQLYMYAAPTSPNPITRAVALAPAFGSLNTMTGELATLSPDTLAAAASASTADASSAFERALTQWATGAANRLDAGASVAWSGEASGYAEAADADGQLLQWQLDDSVEHHCDDCLSLATMPPLPLSEWPCQPGDGTSACSTGCRCNLESYDRTIEPGDTYDPQLSDDQEATIGRLMDNQAAAMSAAIPDAAYLDGGMAESTGARWPDVADHGAAEEPWQREVRAALAAGRAARP
jgi:hypothetical protein